MKLLYNFKKNDILLIFSLSLPKFVLNFLLGMVIPIFPSLIDLYFNSTIDATKTNFSLARNSSGFNYYQLSILFGTKSLFQIVLGPIIGYAINMLGSLIVLLVGVSFHVWTIVLYGVSNIYYLLIIGRLFEAISANAIDGASTTFIAFKFTDHKQRGFVYGVSELFQCFGSASGPAFGGYLYQYYGNSTAFLSVLSFVAVELLFVILILYRERRSEESVNVKIHSNRKVKRRPSLIPLTLFQPFVADNRRRHNISVIPIVRDNRSRNSSVYGVPEVRDSRRRHNSTSTLPSSRATLHRDLYSPGGKHKLNKNILMFFKDPYFIIIIASFPLVVISTFLLHSTLPQYMEDTFHVSESEQGIVWLATIFGYAIGFISGNIINTKFSEYRHVMLTVFTVIHAAAVVCVAFMPTWWSISAPLCFIISIHMFYEIVLTPILVTIVESRYASEFGTMSGIIITVAAISVTIGSFLGPILLSKIGLMYMNIGVCIISLIYAPFFIFLNKFC